MKNPFRYFKTSPEIIRLAVMMCIRFPLSLRQVEDLLHERGIDISHETVRARWNRFGPLFAKEIRKKRVSTLGNGLQWRWHLDEVFVRINGEIHYLWWAVDHEGEILEEFVTKKRDRRAALKFLKKAMKRYGQPKIIVTDKLRSYQAALKIIGNAERQITSRWANNRCETRISRFGEESELRQSSEVSNRSRNLLRSTLQSTTSSIMNVFSTIAEHLKSTVLRL